MSWLLMAVVVVLLALFMAPVVIAISKRITKEFNDLFK